MPSLRRTDFPVDKRLWSPSLIPGPLVLISTRSPQGEGSVAPKSWVQMASFDPPILMFSGTRKNTSEQNILASGCFGVNLVHRGLAPEVFTLPFLVRGGAGPQARGSYFSEVARGLTRVQSVMPSSCQAPAAHPSSINVNYLTT